MAARYPTKREAEALALDSQVPDIASAEIVMMDCVAAVTKYHAVELADDGNHAGIQHPGTAGNRCLGVALKTGAIGDSIPVQTSGLGYVIVGATLTSPDALQGATTGKAIAAATGDIVFADLLEDGVDTNQKLAYIYGPKGYAHA